MKYPARGFIILLAFYFALPALATVRNVQTYGATGNGSTDDTSAINNAINAMVSGDELYFPCPSVYYKISSALNAITKNNGTVDGQTGCSNGRVTIHSTASGGSIMRVGNVGYSSATPLTVDSTEGGTTFTANLSAIGGLSAGNYVLIQMTGKDYSSDSGSGNDLGCDVSGCRGEVLKILSVNSNTATVTTALHYPYDVAHTSSCNANCPGAGIGVVKLTGATDSVSVHDLTFDGSGTAVTGLYMLEVTNSTVTNVTAQNFTGQGLLAYYGFNLAWNTIAITHAGSSAADQFVLFGQGNPSVNGATISSPNTNGFGFGLHTEANGTFTNVTVDGGGVGDRSCKTAAASYNTFNSLTCKNAANGDNGLSLEYYSSHNTYNNCVATGSSSTGIATFGNFNQYNTFINCTVTGNNPQQFVQETDILALHQDHYTTISGGTFNGVANQYSITIRSNNFYIHNATVTGPSSGTSTLGLNISGNNACVDSNNFSGFTSPYDIYESGTGNLFNSNTTPDGTSPGSLPSGSCGSSNPAAPTGLTATVN
jgi:hypothetical protein